MALSASSNSSRLSLPLTPLGLGLAEDAAGAAVVVAVAVVLAVVLAVVAGAENAEGAVNTAARPSGASNASERENQRGCDDIRPPYTVSTDVEAGGFTAPPFTHTDVRKLS